MRKCNKWIVIPKYQFSVCVGQNNESKKYDIFKISHCFVDFYGEFIFSFNSKEFSEFPEPLLDRTKRTEKSTKNSPKYDRHNNENKEENIIRKINPLEKFSTGRYFYEIFQSSKWTVCIDRCGFLDPPPLVSQGKSEDDSNNYNL